MKAYSAHTQGDHRFASLKKLHDIHGAIVRTGPQSISVADKDMIKQVLVHDDLPKGPIYENLRSK